MKLPTNFSLFAITIVLLTLTSCVPLYENTTTPISTSRRSETEFVTKTPEPESFEFSQEIYVKGQVVILDQLNLSFPFSGHVLRLLVNQGDEVREGDLIAQLDTNSLLAEIEKQQGALDFAQAKLEHAMTGPHEAEIKEASIALTAVAAQTPLNRAQATTQASDLAVAQAHLDLLLAQPFPEDVALAQAEVEVAQLNLDISAARLELANLYAPSDGTVTKVYVSAYEYASTGQPIVEISDMSTMTVQAEMDDYDVINVDIGQTLPVIFEALPDVELEGRVLSILPNELGSDRNFIILLGLENSPESVRWGMTATVIVPQK